jgi:hypothetical protein
MKVAILQNLLAPYRMLCNRHAMAPQYKSLQLAPNLIRGCASYGILETPCEMDLDVTGHCYVDAHTFLSVVNSLPETEEILMFPTCRRLPAQPLQRTITWFTRPLSLPCVQG